MPERRTLSTYPLSPPLTSAWIVERRGPRNAVDPLVPYAFVTEAEVGPPGRAWDVATLFLTNRECPFRCLMCDLWQNTLTTDTPAGAIPAQMRHALERLPAAQAIKLYNAGSFFDPRAIPPADYAEVARLCAPFQQVIVESHPTFLGERAARFRDQLRGVTGRDHPLEVAMGLETAHPEILGRLNKGMTLDSFRAGADWLREERIPLRVFILVRPPWQAEAEGVEWAKRSLDFAFLQCGAAVCSLIPTRDGNGAMEALREAGEWSPPSLPSLEAALEYGLRLSAGRVFVDLWDIERFSSCPACSPGRIERLLEMNRTQQIPAQVFCAICGDGR